MKVLLFIIGGGIVLILVYATVVAIWRACMTRYRQKLKNMTADELEKEADRFYRKIVRFSGFFEFGQNYKRYEAALEELEKRESSDAL